MGNWGSKSNTPLGTPKGSNSPLMGSPQHQPNPGYGWGAPNASRMSQPSG